MNTPWVAAENPSFHRFIHKWVGPEVTVQDRRILSGRVLDQEVKKVDDVIRGKVHGKMATGQNDGFKNVAKSSVVSSLMTVEYEPYLIQTHDVTRERKGGIQLLKHTLEDMKLMEEKFGVEVIGWCTDDGPDGKKMRRLLQDLFKWLIIILCWAHQMNLVVGDFLALRQSVTEDINYALEVIKWFNNHSTALALLQTEQILTFEGSFWALILPAITRWTAHYLAITRYLKLKRPLQLCWTRNEDSLVICAGTKRVLQEKARSIHRLVMDEGLWDRLKEIQKILEPLAIAANVAQGSHTRLDHVLLMLGNLVRIFTQNTEFDEDLRIGIIKSLEKRWKKADQDVFIVAVFLNPFIRSSLFNKALLNDVELFAALERVYSRVMRRDSDLTFLAAYKDYRLRRAEFSDERMGLELMQRKFAAEDAPVDMQLIWSRLDRDVDHGRNAIVELAIRISSVIANSAGCERVFSSFGVTHTKRRNKLDPKKVHNMAVVGMQIKREDRELGLARDRKKRKFEEVADEDQAVTPTSSDTVEPVDPTDFRQYAEGLLRQAELSNTEADDDDDDEALPPYILPSVTLPRTPTIPVGSTVTTAAPSTTPASNTQNPRRGQPRSKTQIPLSELFNFTIRPEDGLEFYWPGSKKNLEEELLAHEDVFTTNNTNSTSTTAPSLNT
ncbi:hypothetical protein GALMADRAFT_104095 [Galerina marginata CBS 339.88]|uniref:DUF659 domain-containing protein n=1 Tax=Galerina marginata (strain CBS 339.88) TaxID=685588 RepID=A0A067SHL4_GALM3|nr:hypothetical protein GALMADRAFT_104095 [Galerina marginata CBS 339.88]